jgi:SAM-dependent methyltransferase
MKTDESVLFISNKKQQCGVYQFGLGVGKSLLASQKYAFRYFECDSQEEYFEVVETQKPIAIIYNYVPLTMPWLTRGIIRRFRIPHIGIMHEVSQAVADAANDRLFDFHIAPDPTLLLRNPIVFKTGRLVPRYEGAHISPVGVTIGSFGFGTPGKGFERLVSIVQDEFDQAIVKLLIPYSTFEDADGSRARAIGEQCRALIRKPGIELNVCHDYVTEDHLLEFLGANSMNAFFYEHQPGRGISSVIDFALAVKRPLAVTKSCMFRHIYATRPSITIEDSLLSDILARGASPVAPYVEEWTAENLVWDYERVVNSVLIATRKAARSTGWSPRALWGDSGTTKWPARRRMGHVARTLVRNLTPAARTAEDKMRDSLLGERLIRFVRNQPKMKAGLTVLRTRLVTFGRPDLRQSNLDWIPRDTALVESGTLKDVPPYKPQGAVPGGFNRILDNAAREVYAPAIDYLFRSAPELMARKIREANVQQAFVLDTVLRLVSEKSHPALLCVGSYEDTAAAAINMSGHSVAEIDPVINYDLGTYMTKPSCKRSFFDVVFATSVLEHVADDGQFLKDIEELLAPGGVGVLTCDFNDAYRPGDRIPSADHRFYTRRDFFDRLMPLISRCELEDKPNWQCDKPDFVYDGCRYTFASLVFRKLRSKS